MHSYRSYMARLVLAPSGPCEGTCLVSCRPPTPSRGQIKMHPRTVQRVDNWPARTLLAALSVCEDRPSTCQALPYERFVSASKGSELHSLNLVHSTGSTQECILPQYARDSTVHGRPLVHDDGNDQEARKGPFRIHNSWPVCAQQGRSMTKVFRVTRWHPAQRASHHMQKRE
jgi:hypothetical protein